MNSILQLPRSILLPIGITGQQVDLFSGLVSRELKLLYKRSKLGMAWTLIKPLMQLAVFYLVFGTFLSADIPNFASFLFTGLIAWTWFQSALTEATKSLVVNETLLKQPGFPPAVLPLVSIASGCIHFLLSLPVLLTFLWMENVKFNMAVFALPLVMFVQIVFTAGLAYLTASFNVVFRDVQHTLVVVLQMLFYLSGIFYTKDLVPTSYQIYFQLNPMVHIIAAYRAIFIEGNWPDWSNLILIGVLSFLLCLIGYRLFRRQSVRFVDEL